MRGRTRNVQCVDLTQARRGHGYTPVIHTVYPYDPFTIMVELDWFARSEGFGLVNAIVQWSLLESVEKAVSNECCTVNK